METDNVDNILKFLQQIKTSKILAFVLGVVLLIIIDKIIKKITHNFYNKLPNKRLFLLQVESVFSFTIYVGGGVYIFFSIMAPTREIMIALGGTLAVAGGFALKDLAGSIIAGLILLFDRPFQVGDRVKFQDTYGEIKSIGLRAVRLVTLDDSLVTIPNSKFIAEWVSSGNSGSLDMMIEIYFYVQPKENLEIIKKDVYEVVCTSQFAYLEKPVHIVLEESSIARKLAIKITVKAYVIDVKYEEDFKTDIVTRVSRVFHEKGISRPGD